MKNHYSFPFLLSYCSVFSVFILLFHTTPIFAWRKTRKTLDFIRIIQGLYSRIQSIYFYVCICAQEFLGKELGAQRKTVSFSHGRTPHVTERIDLKESETGSSASFHLLYNKSLRCVEFTQLLFSYLLSQRERERENSLSREEKVKSRFPRFENKIRFHVFIHMLCLYVDVDVYKVSTSY